MDMGSSSWLIAQRHLFQIVWGHQPVYFFLFREHQNARIGYQASGAAMFSHHAEPAKDIIEAVWQTSFRLSSYNPDTRVLLYDSFR
jgi:hypothetical protein